MAEGQERPDLPQTFNQLDDRFFSLGQDATYYVAVIGLGAGISIPLLTALNDFAANNALYQRALDEEVTGMSLMRDVSKRTVEEQYRRILNGGALLSDYNFRYTGPTPQAEGIAPLHLDFEIKPDSRPPTNIHVLIGRNGVGNLLL